jgi:hypothetical protein
MTLKQYAVTINGHETTLQLSDEDAVRPPGAPWIRISDHPIEDGRTK